MRLERARSESDGNVVEPFDGIDTGVTPRIEADPDLHALYVKEENTRRMLERVARESADRDLEIAGERPPETRFARIERRVRFWQWVVTAVAVPAIASTILVGKYLYNRGSEDTRARIERAADHQTIADHEIRVRAMEQLLTELKFRLERDNRRRFLEERLTP